MMLNFDADPEEMQQINFTRDLSDNNDRLILFIIKKAKETVLYFSQGTIKVLWMCSTILFYFKIIPI